MLTPQEEDTFIRLVTPLYRDKLFMESVYQCLRQERAMKTLRNPLQSNSSLRPPHGSICEHGGVFRPY